MFQRPGAAVFDREAGADAAVLRAQAELGAHAPAARDGDPLLGPPVLRVCCRGHDEREREEGQQEEGTPGTLPQSRASRRRAQRDIGPGAFHDASSCGTCGGLVPSRPVKVSGPRYL